MTGDPQRRDESVNVSLKELMKLEEERIRQERRACEAHELAVRTARQEAERRERDAHQARLRTEAEERERLRFREMEEEARREALQRAAVEQARITVEARTRAEESERERRHELELQRMRVDGSRKPAPVIGSALGGAALAVAACLILFLTVWRPAAHLRAAELERAVAGAEARADALGRRVDGQTERIAQLEKILHDTQAERTAKAAPTPPKPPDTGLRTGGRAVPARKAPPPNPNDGPPCAKFDPLCEHIDAH